MARPALPVTPKADSINLPVSYEALRESHNKISADLKKSQQRLQQLTTELQLQQESNKHNTLNLSLQCLIDSNNNDNLISFPVQGFIPFRKAAVVK